MEKLDFLINYLLSERNDVDGIEIPNNDTDKFRLYRSLVNIRSAVKADEDYLQAEDEYLTALTNSKGITDIADLTPIEDGIYLWKGDITTLRCGAIVNAANARLLGCFTPLHGCIDNAIHSAAGMQLRQECHELMLRQGHEEPTGQAKITKAYNLPCKHVIHTVGPIVPNGIPTEHQKEQLASCYRSVMACADENKLKSVAFCCISTGEFHFPNQLAAEIAVRTVTDYLSENPNCSVKKVVFNVFKNVDKEIYVQILAEAD